MDELTSSLYEHIKNRLDDSFEYGDIGQEVVDKIPNHSVWEQSLREDYQGDVGIFEISRDEIEKYTGYTMYRGEIQIVVVCKDNDIDNVKIYLKNTLDNLRNNPRSSMYWFKDVKLLNLRPLGKNKIGNQMCVLNISVKYLENLDTD